MKATKSLSNGQADERTLVVSNAVLPKTGLYTIMNNFISLFSGFPALRAIPVKGSFPAKEKEAISLAVSPATGCGYYCSAHTATARMAGFMNAETFGLREGTILDGRL